MKVIIDRYEGDFAVVELEDRSFANLPKKLIPFGTKEGAVLSITIDKEATEERKAEISKLTKDLWKN